jgi:hypothetical protein
LDLSRSSSCTIIWRSRMRMRTATEDDDAVVIFNFVVNNYDTEVEGNC